MAIAELTPSGAVAQAVELIETFESRGDRADAQLLAAVIRKFEQQKFTVACCGYVSAGKSRLINALIDEAGLLPVSPLPSSRNTVWIRATQQTNLRVKYRDKSWVSAHWPEPEELQSLCQNDDVEGLELNLPTPEGLSYIDTPGIDSLESGAKLLANPALLLADLVVYVTDYNHVQSQVNFNFLKGLQSYNIPYLLVVNQIDKHVSLELALAEFRGKLILALEQWDLQPLQVYFTSLAGNRHVECQFNSLKQELYDFQDQASTRLQGTLIRAVKQVIKQHVEFTALQQANHRQPYVWATEQPVPEQEVRASSCQLAQDIHQLTSLPETMAAETLLEINKLLENAPLFSFATRGLAQRFLESRQPGFRAGLLAGKARTKVEQELRLQQLYAELVTRAEANLTWHLRKILAALPDRYSLATETFATQAAALEVQLAPQLLLDTLRPGAVVSGESVMNYTRDLADAIKAVYRQSSQNWIREAQAIAARQNAPKVSCLQEKLDQDKLLLEAFTKLNELDAQLQAYLRQLMLPWVKLEEQLLGTDNYPESGAKQHSGIVQTAAKDSNSSERQHTAHPRKFPGPTRQGEVTRSVHPKLWAAANKLHDVANLVVPLPGFGASVETLRQRADRLEHNLFTVALFGAFSAGKSSLANALLGELILPVSPNPTTAAINKILPPTPEHPHGTIKVKLKTLPDLTADLLTSLMIVGHTARDWEGVLQQLPNLDPGKVSTEAKPHLSFLKAVERGREGLWESLAQEILVDFAAFGDFVVQEEKACFVEWIEVYYACPLTEMGIVLVDTPGSNSTNARHTNVAFEYIKNADAVLFVTYYNNPLCRADAQFLAQLGKVQATFALDKMFFLVNAADLAQTPKEMDQVLQHVEQSLRTCDILRPRLFPISSQLALLAKLAAAEGLPPEAEQLYRQRLNLTREQKLPDPALALATSGLAQFTASFLAFIEQDLITLALEAAHREIMRISQQVNSLLDAAKTDATQRAAKGQGYASLKQSINKTIAVMACGAEEHAVEQEIDELFYYVSQRLAHRFGDMFNRCFYALSLPHVEQPKLVVQHCLSDLLQEVTVELEQEMRATGLRVEKFVSKALQSIAPKAGELIKQIDPDCSLSYEREFHFGSQPVMPGPGWDSSGHSKVTNFYKNPKDWLEGQGRAKMRDAIFKLVEPQAQQWLNRAASALKEMWLPALRTETARLKEQLQAEITDHYTGLQAALGNGFDQVYLEQVRTALTTISGGR